MTGRECEIMNQSSQKTLIAVLIAAITIALAALGITAGIYYGKTHPKQTADNPAALETTAVSQTVTTVSVSTTADAETSVVSATETTAETTVTEVPETTIPEEETPEPQEEAPAEETPAEEAPAEETPPAEEPAPALPYISSAEIVGVYNDYGAGYMFRLDLQGNYAYWIAEVTETEFAPGDPYVHTVSSRDLTANYPYITGGSTINTLRATITPYDANGVAGTPFTTVWDPNRTEHQ